MTMLRAAALTCALTFAITACAEGTRPSASPSESATPSGTPSLPSLSPSPIPTTAPTVAPLPTDLPDGQHYAFLERLDTAKRQITVDVAQFLTGEEAEQAAQEDGEEAFDYYVRNQNPRLRDLTFAARLTIVTNTLTADESGSSSKDVTITLAKLASFVKSGRAKNALFRFELKGGVVVRLHEQYLP